MAKTIAIQLEVDGVKQAVTNINELETAIEQLTAELKNTEIGSEKFSQLSNELNTANSKLKDFQKSFEGLEPAQQAQAYLAFGESVVSGILLAQEALRSFGVENESVNNAVESSTRAINIALQSRILLEGVLEARVLATSIAQKALNTATVQGNRVLKALFVTMAANPIGAVLAVIGLLVAAFILLSDSTDDSTKAFGENEDAQKSLAIQSAVTARELKLLTKQTELLIKEYDNFDLTQATDELNKLEDELVKVQEANENIRFSDFNALAEEIIKGTKSIDKLNLSLSEQEALLDVSFIAYEKYISVLGDEATVTRNIKSIENLIKVLEDSIATAGAETEQLQKRIIALRSRIDALKKSATDKVLDSLSNSISNTADEVDRLNRSLLEFGDTPEPEIIESLKELLALQLQLREAAEENEKTLSDVFTGYIADVDKVKSGTDVFGDQVDLLREQLTTAFVEGDVENFAKNLDAARKLFLDTGDTFNEEQKRAITQILSGYEVAFNSITKLGVEGTDEFKTIIDPLLDGLTNKLQLEGQINFTETEGKIQEFSLKLENVTKGTTEFYEKRQELIEEFTRTALKGKNLGILSDEESKKATEEATQAATEQADAIIEIITNTTKAEDAIRGVLFAQQQLSKEVKDTSNDFNEIFGLIITNFDKISEEFNLGDLLSVDPADQQENLQAIDNFFLEVSEGQINLEEFTLEEREKLLEFFLAKRKELIEKSVKEEEDIQKESLEETLGNLQEVLSSISQIGQSLAENSQFQIDIIQRQTESLLDEVVGDTKEAADLREEIQEDSTRKILELERRGELRSLQFAKIEAISQLAVATVRALALPPPFNAIAAAAVGVAGSLQIGLIQTQIEDLKSVPAFAQGGLVQGEGTATSDSIPAMLSNGEFVVNAKSTKEYLPLLKELNQRGLQKFAQGGFVLDNPISSDLIVSNNTFDDSRLIQALERRDTTPLRAYVFEKEITNAQDIEKRLQELSKL